MIEKTFPIMPSEKSEPHPMRIPWDVAELAYSRYAGRFGVSQSLERLAERGGFHSCEMDEFVPDWRERCSTINKLKAEIAQTRLATLEEVKDHILRTATGRPMEWWKVTDILAWLDHQIAEGKG